MKKRKDNPFWISFSDLMTSLFFIMLVLYIITFAVLKYKIKDNIKINKELEELIQKKDTILKVYETVESNLEALKKEKELFKYDTKYKRYLLSFEVFFKKGKFDISNPNSLHNQVQTIIKIRNVGRKLKQLVDKLKYQKLSDPKYKNISYLVVITGSASDLGEITVFENYILSFKRSYFLYKYWKENLNIDFDDQNYHNIIDLQISGVGIGGIGRFPKDPQYGFHSEKKNQRFIINIVPKIGKIAINNP